MPPIKLITWYNEYKKLSTQMTSMPHLNIISCPSNDEWIVMLDLKFANAYTWYHHKKLIKS